MRYNTYHFIVNRRTQNVAKPIPECGFYEISAGDKPGACPGSRFYFIVLIGLIVICQVPGARHTW
jgi:hypothetical protein